MKNADFVSFYVTFNNLIHNFHIVIHMYTCVIFMVSATSISYILHVIPSFICQKECMFDIHKLLTIIFLCYTNYGKIKIGRKPDFNTLTYKSIL